MPITVGELDNVPNPGDPITSPWAQDVSSRVVHRFASFAELTAQWPNPPSGAVAAIDTATLRSFGGVWRAMGLITLGTLGYGPLNSDVAGLSELIRSAIPTYPFPIAVQVTAVVGFGNGNAAGGMDCAVVLNRVNPSGQLDPGLLRGHAALGKWVRAPLTATYTAVAGGDANYSVARNALDLGGAGGNAWYEARSTHLIYGA